MLKSLYFTLAFLVTMNLAIRKNSFLDLHDSKLEEGSPNYHFRSQKDRFHEEPKVRRR